MFNLKSRPHFQFIGNIREYKKQVKLTMRKQCDQPKMWNILQNNCSELLKINNTMKGEKVRAEKNHHGIKATKEIKTKT